MRSNWQKVKLGQITENLDNKRVPISKEKRAKGDIPYYGATGIVDYVNDFIFNEPLLLIGEDGADWSKFADTAYSVDDKSWVNNHAHVLRCSGVDRTFLKEYLNFEDLNNFITGGTRGKLTKGVLSDIPIPLAPLRIQQKIAAILSSIDEEIQKTDQIIQKSEELKNGLMNELLTKGVSHKKFKKTKFGEIPSDWELFAMQDICKVRQGLQIAIRDRRQESGENRFLYLTNQYLKNFDKPEYIDNPPKSVICKEDDVLMTRTGNTGVLVTDVNGVFHNNFFLIDFDRSRVNKRFLVYFLQNNMIQKMILDRAGSTTIPDLKHGDFYSLPFICPSLSEQSQISEMIRSIDDKMSYERKQLIFLINLKNGLMQDIFSQKVQVA
ncbi:MAG: restriction endonuclease subunit S [Patescibacteria group bacterium]